MVQSLVVMPGTWSRRYVSRADNLAPFDVWEHGWPFVHLTRIQPVNWPRRQRASVSDLSNEDVLRLTRQAGKDFNLIYASRDMLFRRSTPGSNEISKSMRHWSNSENWAHFGGEEIQRWFWFGLLANAVVFACLIGLVFLVSEFFRRQKQKWYQITLKEVLLGLLLVGCISGWLIWVKRAPRLQADACKRLLTRCYFNWPNTRQLNVDSVGLNWFERLMDGSFDPFVHANPATWKSDGFPMYFEVKSLNFFPGTRRNLNGIEKELDHWAFSKLRHVGIDLHDIDDMRIIQSLTPTHIESIYIGNGVGAEVDLEVLERFENMKQLSLYSFDFKKSVPSSFELLDRLRLGGGDNHEMLKTKLKRASQLSQISLDEDAFAVLHDSIPVGVRQVELETSIKDLGANLHKLKRLSNLETIKVSIKGLDRIVHSEDIKTWPEFPALKTFACLVSLRSDEDALNEIVNWVGRQTRLRNVSFWKAETAGMGMKLPKDDKWTNFSEQLNQLNVVEFQSR